MNKDELSIGQQVVVHDRNEGRLGGPWPGEIVKIGRLLVTIKGNHSEDKYGIEDQSIRGKWDNSWFRTLEQEAVTQQRSNDTATLAEHGFEFSWKRKPSDEVVHRVAEFLRDG